MTYGFEREYFVLSQRDEFMLAPHTIPHDDCGYLAEARGDKADTAIKAAYLLEAAEHSIMKQAEKLDIRLVVQTPQRLPKALMREAMRQFGKGIQTNRSMSGRWNKQGYQHAGLHVHFGEEQRHFCKDGTKHTFSTVIDIPKYVMALDKRFKDHILDSKRALGNYEIKPWGFEYRSLPASVDPVEVADFIETIK